MRITKQEARKLRYDIITEVRCRQSFQHSMAENLIKIPAQLINVLEHSLRKPTVRICVDEQLHVEHASDLNNEHGKSLRLNCCLFNHFPARGESNPCSRILRIYAANFLTFIDAIKCLNPKGVDKSLNNVKQNTQKEKRWLFIVRQIWDGFPQCTAVE